MRRRTVLAATASLALPLPGLILGARSPRAESGADRFVFEGGIGRRAGGPSLQVLRGEQPTFPRADRLTWWQPGFSVDSFSRLDEIFPVSTAHAAATASPWQRAPREPDFRYTSPPFLGGGRFDIDGYLDRNPVTGLLIAQGDTILLERYQYGRSDAMRLTSFSMAKTVIGILTGLAQEDGLIRSLDDPAETFAKSLAGTEYGRTPVRALLTMSSGVKFREEYDGNDDVSKLSRNTFYQATAGGADAVRPFNERIAEPGKRWYYASSETFVLAMVCRAAFGRPLSTVLQERVWQPMGAEADATWLTDASDLELGYMGFNAVLRDYARLGRLLANGGEAGGRRLVPRAYVEAMSSAQFTPSQTGKSTGYGYQTWIIPGREPSFGLFGVRGQFVLVDPALKLVMANTAVRTDPRDRGNADTFALWDAVRTTLRG
jgi:CubicO group peptidase (beta-lactamase class C family)